MYGYKACQGKLKILIGTEISEARLEFYEWQGEHITVLSELIFEAKYTVIWEPCHEVEVHIHTNTL